MVSYLLLLRQAKVEIENTYTDVWNKMEKFLMEGNMTKVRAFFQEASQIPQPNYLNYALSNPKKERLMSGNLGQDKVIARFDRLLSFYQHARRAFEIIPSFVEEEISKDQEQLERVKSYYELFWKRVEEVTTLDPKQAQSEISSLNASLHPEKQDKELSQNPYFVPLKEGITTGSGFAKMLETIKVMRPLYGICIAIANEMTVSLQNSVKKKDKPVQKVK